MGQDSSVGIANCYGLDGPGIESCWETGFSAPFQTGPGAHSTSCAMGFGSLTGVKRSGRGVDHPPHLVPMLKKELGCIFISPLGLHSLFYGELCLYLLVYVTLSVTQNYIASINRIFNEYSITIDVQGSNCSLLWCNVSEFFGRYWGKSPKCFSITCFRTEIWIQELQNIQKGCSLISGGMRWL